MTDIEERLADPEFLNALNGIVERVMALRVSEGQVPPAGPRFEEERKWLAVEVLHLFLRA